MASRTGHPEFQSLFCVDVARADDFVGRARLRGRRAARRARCGRRVIKRIVAEEHGCTPPLVVWSAAGRLVVMRGSINHRSAKFAGSHASPTVTWRTATSARHLQTLSLLPPFFSRAPPSQSAPLGTMLERETEKANPAPSQRRPQLRQNTEPPRAEHQREGRSETFTLRGPLCAGEAFSLRPRGRGGNCKPWRDVGPRFVLPLRSTPRPHISPLGWLRQKGGLAPAKRIQGGRRD